MAVSVYANNKLATEKLNEGWTKLFELVPAGSRVLDIGCSSGNFGGELTKQKQCEVVGIDINDADLAIAKKNLKAVYNRNIERDEIDDLGNFDVIFMADVIEHLIDPVSALKKLAKQLKQNGMFVFSVPNMANFSTRLELLAGRFTYTTYGLLDETHLHYYDRVELENVFVKSGLHVTTYDNTVRDVPRPAATKLLADIGLTPSESFWKLAEHIDSITFQFIGVAKKGTAGHEPLTTKAPHDFISQMLDDVFAQQRSAKEQATDLNKQLKAAQKELKGHADHAARLRTELDSIYNSKAWKLVSKARDTRHKLKF